MERTRNLAIFLEAFALFCSLDVDLRQKFCFRLNASLYFLLDVSCDDYEGLYFLWPIVYSTNKEKLSFYFFGRYCMNNSSKNMAKFQEHISSEDRLVFSFKKDNFKRIGDAFMRCLSFFYILQRSLWEYEAQGSSPPRTIPCPDGLVRRLLCLEEK